MNGEDADVVLPRQHQPVKRRVLRLAAVIQFFAQPFGDFLRRLARVDRRIEPPVQGERHVELGEIGLDRRGHVGILQLAGDILAGKSSGPMHLAERGGGGGMQVEGREFLAPVRPKLSSHPSPDEGRAHRRRLALQGDQRLGVIGGQGFGDGGDELRRLHQRSLEAAERAGQSQRVAVPALAEQPAAG